MNGLACRRARHRPMNSSCNRALPGCDLVPARRPGPQRRRGLVPAETVKTLRFANTCHPIPESCRLNHTIPCCTVNYTASPVPWCASTGCSRVGEYQPTHPGAHYLSARPS